jgi:hypothetical protein
MLEVLTCCTPWHWINCESLYRQRLLDPAPNAFDAAMTCGQLEYAIVDVTSKSVAPVLCSLEALMRDCLATAPSDRPEMIEVINHLEALRTDTTGIPAPSQQATQSSHGCGYDVLEVDDSTPNTLSGAHARVSGAAQVGRCCVRVSGFVSVLIIVAHSLSLLSCAHFSYE